MNPGGLARTLSAALGWAEPPDATEMNDDRLALEQAWDEAMAEMDALLARMEAAEDEMSDALGAAIAEPPRRAGVV